MGTFDYSKWNGYNKIPLRHLMEGIAKRKDRGYLLPSSSFELLQREQELTIYHQMSPLPSFESRQGRGEK